MPQAFTIRPEDANVAMQRLIRVPDVRHAVVIDAIGLCLAHVGHEPVSNKLLNDWTVVARAAFAAGDQLGQRSGVGNCVETVQAHADGGILIRALSGGMLLVVQHGVRTPVDDLRKLAAETASNLPTAVEVKAPKPAMASANDPFAGDGWWSEANPHQGSNRTSPPLTDHGLAENVPHGVLLEAEVVSSRPVA